MIRVLILIVVCLGFAGWLSASDINDCQSAGHSREYCFQVMK